MKRLAQLFLAAALTAAPSLAQIGPDITVSRIGESNNDYNEFGPADGVYAYAMATTSCNRGDVVASWTGSNHPVIAQQAYRIDENGDFEMLGMAWLKHGFCAVSEPSCGSCQGTPCNTLGIGCADTYWAGLNDSGLATRSNVNAATGFNPGSGFGPSGGSASVRGRMQIPVGKVAQPGSTYFFEAQYVSLDDQQAGNGQNSLSYREVSFSSPTAVLNALPIVEGSPALFAWPSYTPGASVVNAYVTDEGGTGAHGVYNVGFRATDNGDGTWRYRYVVHNQTSDRSAGSFRIEVPVTTTISNRVFHDVDYHGGEPWDSTDWIYSEGPGSTLLTKSIGWSTNDFAKDQNANAIRWGSAYDFTFDADLPPGAGAATIGLFKPGTPADISAGVLVPAASPEPGIGFCFGDTGCPCGNDDVSGTAGCANSTGSGATLSGSGSRSVSADDLVLTVSNVPSPNANGIVFMGPAILPPFVPTDADGLACTGGGLRFPGILDDNSPPNELVQANLVAESVLGGAPITAGATWHFQSWMRDNNGSPCGGSSNLSNGYTVTFIP